MPNLVTRKHVLNRVGALGTNPDRSWDSLEEHRILSRVLRPCLGCTMDDIRQQKDSARLECKGACREYRKCWGAVAAAAEGSTSHIA